MPPSPSQRHTLGAKLSRVKLDVLGVYRMRNLPPTYRLAGRLTGQGVTRAGIYIDGRLAQRIPVISGAKITSFDQSVVVQGGSLTLRAYGVGDEFVEQGVDVSEAEDASEMTDTDETGMVSVAPIPSSDIAIQITALRPAGGNLYVVSSTISGPDVVSAGLYQNGALAQRINLASGIAGALGALLHSGSGSHSFSTRFSPYAGPASIRAFDANGAYTQNNPS